jgi:small-conductance mechanosensitive channel
VVLAAAWAVLAGLPAGDATGAGAVALIGTAALAHRTVRSLLAGAGLALARPFSAGERVRLYVPELHGVVEAEIVRIGAANTTLATGTGILVVPNARMLRRPPEDRGDDHVTA